MAMRSTSLTRQICRPTVWSLTASTHTGLKSRNLRDACTGHIQPAQAPAFAPTRSVTGLPVLNRRYATTKSSTQSFGTGDTGITGAPDITDYYTIFPRTIPAGPPPASSFDISIGDLRREFLQLQNLVHPDKYPSGDAKQHAEAISARINEAYRTLLDPLQRAQYLLREWHGIDVTAEDGASKHALDPQTLMEVMEVQETIEEVGASPEAEAEINALKKENDQRIEACVKSLGDAVDQGDIETARKECVRLRFWYSVGEGLREWEPGSTEIRLVHSS
ncbi:Heat shock cognate protein B C-terminal oligomerization [Penicillium odoratum]|uniref:Heat shock cognate protein B C-terminal oligomerization n=1 Tax=Penicillium odoratum TaxID=1167516 RepID=UPI00254867D7|nr:Heat shock cognate protein B C-terminal oligomerization [Penicillium odoratum]KAJ5777067.1 Heat shock cognate protein B C-terminal oligomerization [Penicillium odoratum]